MWSMCALNTTNSFLRTGSLPGRMPTTFGANLRSTIRIRACTCNWAPPNDWTARLVADCAALRSPPRRLRTIAAVDVPSPNRVGRGSDEHNSLRSPRRDALKLRTIARSRREDEHLARQRSGIDRDCTGQRSREEDQLAGVIP